MSCPAKLRSGLNLLLSLAVSSYISQAETLPTAWLERGLVIVDKQGNPKRIQVEFGVAAEFPVREVHLFYRIPSKTEYEQVKLERNPALRYVGSIRAADRVEYYLEVKPERGLSLPIGSSEEPRVLDSSVLNRVQKAGMSPAKKVMLALVSIVVAILGVGIAKKKG